MADRPQSGRDASAPRTGQAGPKEKRVAKKNDSRDALMASLLAARATAAQAVQQHGEAYLPIFERMDAEVKALEKRRASLQQAAEIAAGAGA